MEKIKTAIANTNTFSVAHEIATELHFSITNLGCLYGVFTLGIVGLVPGLGGFAKSSQRAIGRFAFMVGKKEG